MRCRSIAYFVSNLSEKTQRNETVSAIGEDLFAIALDNPFRFPATFTCVSPCSAHCLLC